MKDTVPADKSKVNAESESYGWFRAMRSPDALELISVAPLAYVLAAVIAHRGQYRPGFNRFNLGPGEALLGDYATIGMTEQQYRTAKEQLAKWNFATFKATNKGTIGRLTDTRLFSIFRLEDNGQNHNRVTDSQRPKQRTGNDPDNDFQDQKIRRTKNIRAKEVSHFSKTESIDPTK